MMAIMQYDSGYLDTHPGSHYLHCLSERRRAQSILEYVLVNCLSFALSSDAACSSSKAL